MTSFYFVIDTDHYAGNFERQMCAYITGQVGECGVGAEEVKRFEEKVHDDELKASLEGLIVSEPDDHGCRRPAKIYENPNWFNNGHGGHFRVDVADADDKAQAAYNLSVIASAKQALRAYAHVPDYAEEQARNVLKRLNTPFSRYPAYMSVAICINREPSADEIEFFRARARAFAKSYQGFDDRPSPIGIESFRIIRKTTVVDETAV